MKVMGDSRNLLLTSVPAANFKKVENLVDVVDVKLDQALAKKDQPIEYVWFPHNCVTSTVVMTDDGSLLEVGLMGAEGMVGLSLLLREKVSNTTVIVQIAGKASRMRAADFTKHVVESDGPLFQLIQKY